MKTSESAQQERIRTTVLMHQMADQIGAQNYQQFATAFDSVFPERCSTLGSSKWRLYFDGKKGKRAIKQELLEMFCVLWPDAETFYKNGPSDLWLAMWGNESELWALCRTRFIFDGPDYSDLYWRLIEDQFKNEIPFDVALHEFEGGLLLAREFNRPLSIRHLAEAVAFLRLLRFMGGAAPLSVNGDGAYRCVRICLENESVRKELDWLTFYGSNLCEVLSCQLADVEFCRLTNNRSNRESIAKYDLGSYLSGPLATICDDERWGAPRVRIVVASIEPRTRGRR